MEGKVSASIPSVTTESRKRPHLDEVDGSNKRQKTQSEVNGKEYVVVVSTETKIRPEMPDLSPSSASLTTRNVEPVNSLASVVVQQASDLSQIQR